MVRMGLVPMWVIGIFRLVYIGNCPMYSNATGPMKRSKPKEIKQYLIFTCHPQK